LKEDELDGACSMQNVRRNTYKIVFGKHQSSIRMIKSRNVKGVGHVARTTGKTAYRVLIGRPRSIQEDSIQMYLRELESECGSDLEVYRRIAFKCI
jgi:hypothetical protein